MPKQTKCSICGDPARGDLVVCEKCFLDRMSVVTNLNEFWITMEQLKEAEKHIWAALVNVQSKCLRDIDGYVRKGLLSTNSSDWDYALRDVRDHIESLNLFISQFGLDDLLRKAQVGEE